MPAWSGEQSPERLPGRPSPKEEWQVMGRGLQERVGSHGGLRTNNLLIPDAREVLNRPKLRPILQR